MILKSLTAAALGLAVTVGAAAAPEPNKPAPTFSGRTTDGRTLSLADLKGKMVVLEWTNHDCPYVRKHYDSSNMQSLQSTLTDEGVVWLTIISSAPDKQGHVSAEDADRLTEERGAAPSHVILDPQGAIGRLYDAKTTPHMFLIDEEGMVRYMGAIDDKPSSRPSTLAGARNYVMAAYQAVKAGRLPEEQVTRPYGCSVKY